MGATSWLLGGWLLRLATGWVLVCQLPRGLLGQLLRLATSWVLMGLPHSMGGYLLATGGLASYLGVLASLRASYLRRLLASY